MTSMELFELLGSIGDKYVTEARESAAPARRLPRRRLVLIAAMIALSLLLVGCTVAYVNGWFTDFFAGRSETPLSSEQIEFIQENEQIIQESQTKNGWTIELKSAITDGETAYVIFGITAPEDVDLEESNINTPTDLDQIIPGNAPSMVRDSKSRTMFATSIGIAAGLGNGSPEHNTIWSESCGWEPDNDGLSNTLNYVFRIGIDKFDPSKEILLDDPFASDIEFQFVFQNFIHAWEDAEKRAEIDAKYAGQDYMIDGEEMEGLYKSEILMEETWEFTITFDEKGLENKSVELITEPIMTWGIVTWKLDDEPLFYQTGSGMAAVKITSFLLNPFGATITYEFEEPAYNAFIEYQSMFGYTDRYIYAVMKDGSQIALHTDSVGYQLTAETPIVLSELDYILLGDGVQIPMPD
ncbi:MAG: DUF4179 domain-containing protein [Oscillospiraceae bacterium]|nr:DUF4179 domain-containing protein [Oscillospiraceae bacterium]